MAITVEESVKLKLDYSELRADVQKIVSELGGIDKKVKEIGDFQKFKATAEAVWDGAKAIKGMIEGLAASAAEGAKLLDQQRAYNAAFGESGQGLDEMIEKNSRYVLSQADSQAQAIKLKEAGLGIAAIQDVSASTAALAAAHYVDQGAALAGVVTALQGGKMQALQKLGFTKEETAHLKTQGDLQAALLIHAAALGQAGATQVSNAAALSDAIGDVDENFAKFLASNREADALMGAIAGAVNGLGGGMEAAYSWAVKFVEQLMRAKDYLFYYGTLGMFSAAGRGAMDVDASRRAIADKASPQMEDFEAQVRADAQMLKQAETYNARIASIEAARVKAEGLMGTGAAIGRGGKKSGKASKGTSMGWVESLLEGNYQPREWNLFVETVLSDLDRFKDVSEEWTSSWSTTSAEEMRAIMDRFDAMAESAEAAAKRVKAAWRAQDLAPFADFLGELGAGVDGLVQSGMKGFLVDLVDGVGSAGDAAKKASGMMLSALGEFFIGKGLGALWEAVIAAAQLNFVSAGLFTAGGLGLIALGTGLSAGGSSVSASAAGAPSGAGSSATSFSTSQAQTPAKAWGQTQERESWTVVVNVHGALMHDMADVGVYAQKGIDAARAKKRISKAA